MQSRGGALAFAAKPNQMTVIRRYQVVALASGLAMSLIAHAADPPFVQWVQQAGTSQWECASGVAVQGLGNVSISGSTLGSLAGPTAGGFDAVVGNYERGGQPIWTTQFGTASPEQGHSIATDSSGNVYIVGYTSGALAQPPATIQDAFLRKYDRWGNVQWTRQWGSSAGGDAGFRIAIGPGGAVYAGVIADSAGSRSASIVKFDSDGNQAWQKNFRGAGDTALGGLSVDSQGNCFIAGSIYTTGGPNPGTTDAFVAKFDAGGGLKWQRQFGTPVQDCAYGMAVDAVGNVYLTGDTVGDLGGRNAGSCDGFIAKYDGEGNPVWARQFGTAVGDTPYALIIGATGILYAAGSTQGTLGAKNFGGEDAFVTSFDADGNQLWMRQFGTPELDEARGIAVDDAQHIYVAGGTYGSLGATNAGGEDAYVAALYVPEPTAVPLLAMMSLFFARRRRR